MTRHLTLLLLTTIFLGSCAPATASPTPPETATTTQTIISSETPPPTQTAVPTTTQFSVTQIRIPSDTDGRQIITSFWSQDGTSIYYALINEIADEPFWFEILLNNGKTLQDKQLQSHPKLNYTPFFPIGGVYSEYQGLISPNGRYRFQIDNANNDTLFVLDSIEQSKVKVLETSDMNFRGAYWKHEENTVTFGIGPEYGTEIYTYNLAENKLIPIEQIIGYNDPNIFEWTLSPDGKYIAILDENLHIFSMDGDYTATIPGYQNNIRWAGNSKRIFFYSGAQIYTPTSINYLDLPTNTTKQTISLSELEKLGIRGSFDVSPDGTQLVIWQSGNIWLISLEQ